MSAAQQDRTHPQGSTGGGSTSGSSQGSPSQGGPSPLEWALAAASALLVLGVVGFLLYEALAEPLTPPEVAVAVEAIRPLQSGYLVEFRAENRGQTTAAGLHIEGTLKRGSATVETASTTLDYVPAEAGRRGGLYFTVDPRAYELSVRPTGYGRP